MLSVYLAAATRAGIDRDRGKGLWSDLFSSVESPGPRNRGSYRQAHRHIGRASRRCKRVEVKRRWDIEICYYSRHEQQKKGQEGGEEEAVRRASICPSTAPPPLMHACTQAIASKSGFQMDRSNKKNQENIKRRMKQQTSPHQPARPVPNKMPPEQSTFNNDTPVQSRLDQEGKTDNDPTFNPRGHRVFNTSHPRRSYQQS